MTGKDKMRQEIRRSCRAAGFWLLQNSENLLASLLLLIWLALLPASSTAQDHPGNELGSSAESDAANSGNTLSENALPEDQGQTPDVDQAPDMDSVEILSDKVYLYNYFNVLFKTPFQLEEIIRIDPAQKQQEGKVLRTEKLDYSNYQNAAGEDRRAFILGFYTVATGLLQLPSFRFQSTADGREWLSPSIEFASFQVDEGKLPLPVDVQLNPLPSRVYLGQNILLNVTARYVKAIDQSSLTENPEFTGFLVQKSPIKPDVERLKILNKDVYRISLGTWLLNPLEQGQLSIPAISANIMGLQRQTLAQKIQVLPLPPNPFLRNSKSSVAKDAAANAQGKRSLPDTSGTSGDTTESDLQSAALKNDMLQGNVIAIGQFEVSFQLLPAKPFASFDDALSAIDGQQANSETELQQREKVPFAESAEFAKDELIHVVLRLKGHGNIHMLTFPEVRAPSSLTLLQSEESESLNLDFANADLLGWREKEFIYKPRKSGKYRIHLDNMHFFDPERATWRKISSQDLTVHVVNLATQSYYSNLEELRFSDASVLFFNLMFWLQHYAFYICLIIFLITSIYFLLQVPNLPFLDKLHQQRSGTRYDLYQDKYYAEHFGPMPPTAAPNTLQANQPTGKPAGKSISNAIGRFMGKSAEKVTGRSMNKSMSKSIGRQLRQAVFLLHQQYRRLLFTLLIVGLAWLLYSFTESSNRKTQAELKQHYLEVIGSQIDRQAKSDSKVNASSIRAKLRDARFSPGNLPNIALMLYQNGLPLQALELAYLAYFYQPLQSISRRLVSSLRIQMGLAPSLPDFFFWPLQLYHSWKYLAIGIFLTASLVCIRQRRKQVDFELDAPVNSQIYRYAPPQNHLAKKYLLQRYRNYTILVVLLLLCLSLPWNFSLAVNTVGNLQLEAIPLDSPLAQAQPKTNSKSDTALANNVQNYGQSATQAKPRSWNNQLVAGELLKVKGKANGIYYLVIGETQDQGWLPIDQLFLLPAH